MSNASASPTASAWAEIEKERRRDRVIRRVCIVAWTVTGLLVLFFAAAIAFPVVQMMRAAAAGAIPWITVIGSAWPFFGAVWTLCLLVSTLSTVAVFLRLRTASLAEIQQRLAQLEEILGSRPDSSAG
jgi:uncharacterized BrkB/YihY/UPF0761 family membrane protein